MNLRARTAELLHQPQAIDRSTGAGYAYDNFQSDLTSHILSFRRVAFSGQLSACLTSHILSFRRVAFSGQLTAVSFRRVAFRGGFRLTHERKRRLAAFSSRGVEHEASFCPLFRRGGGCGALIFRRVHVVAATHTSSRRNPACSLPIQRRSNHGLEDHDPGRQAAGDSGRCGRQSVRRRRFRKSRVLCSRRNERKPALDLSHGRRRTDRRRGGWPHHHLQHRELRIGDDHARWQTSLEEMARRPADEHARRRRRHGLHGVSELARRSSVLPGCL